VMKINNIVRTLTISAVYRKNKINKVL